MSAIAKWLMLIHVQAFITCYISYISLMAPVRNYRSELRHHTRIIDYRLGVFSKYSCKAKKKTEYLYSGEEKERVRRGRGIVALECEHWHDGPS